jgi:hypothetical protein
MAWCLVEHRDNFTFSPLTSPSVSFRHCVRTDSGVQPGSYPMGTASFSSGAKRPWRESDHSPTSCTEVKNVWSYTSTPQYVFMVCCLICKAWNLVKRRENILFYLLHKWTNKARNLLKLLPQSVLTYGHWALVDYIWTGKFHYKMSELNHIWTGTFHYEMSKLSISVLSIIQFHSYPWEKLISLIKVGHEHILPISKPNGN